MPEPAQLPCPSWLADAVLMKMPVASAPEPEQEKQLSDSAKESSELTPLSWPAASCADSSLLKGLMPAWMVPRKDSPALSA